MEERHPENGMESVLQKYSAMVYRIAYARTKNAADAEDVMQDVFLCCLTAGAASYDDEHLKAWLIRVTVNVSRNLLHSAWFRKTQPLPETVPASAPEGSDVLEAVLALPLKYRTVVHLYYYEGLPVAEIGRALGLGESTVKSRLLRARKKLGEALKEEYGYAGDV